MHVCMRPSPWAVLGLHRGSSFPASVHQHSGVELTQLQGCQARPGAGLLPQRVTRGCLARSKEGMVLHEFCRADPWEAQHIQDVGCGQAGVGDKAPAGQRPQEPERPGRAWPREEAWGDGGMAGLHSRAFVDKSQRLAASIQLWLQTEPRRAPSSGLSRELRHGYAP